METVSISVSTLMVQEDATVRRAIGCRLMDRVVQVGVDYSFALAVMIV